MRIKEFLLNSQHQVVCKVVREVLNLFKMELPVPVEKLPYEELLPALLRRIERLS